MRGAPRRVRAGLAGALTAVATALGACDVDLPPRAPPPTSADYCGPPARAPAAGATVLTVWASAPRQHCLRLYAPAIVADSLPDIDVAAVEKNINSTPYRHLLKEAAERGEAPDISFVYNGKVRELAAAGHLHPLTECAPRPEPRPWVMNGTGLHDWAVPFESDLLALYYNRALLERLGWTRAELDSLPARIARGDFTLENLWRVARTGRELGLVSTGAAFVPREDRYASFQHWYLSAGGPLIDLDADEISVDLRALEATFEVYDGLYRSDLLSRDYTRPAMQNLGNRMVLRDALAHGRLLFAHAETSAWRRMMMDHVPDPLALARTIGMAPLPAAVDGGPGSVLVRSTGSYVIFAERASGRTHQQAACTLLRAVQRSTLVRVHARNTAQPAVEADGFWMPEALAALRGVPVLWSPLAHPDVHAYLETLRAAVTRYSPERSNPAVAAAELAAELQAIARE